MRLRRALRDPYASWQVPRCLHIAPAPRLWCSWARTRLNQLKSSARAPGLSTGGAPLVETKVHDDCTSEGLCVIHMHHGKSLVACMLLLHRDYGAHGREHSSIQLTSSARAPGLSTRGAPLVETKVHDDCASEGLCVIHMHHGKSLVACILLQHRDYGAHGREHGSIQLKSSARAPGLSTRGAPLVETKVHDDCASEGLCVNHMHHGK